MGLDLSEAQSENITISVVGKADIKGGKGLTGSLDGFAGILATGKNLTFITDGEFIVSGGDAENATELGANGGDGGCGVIASQIIFETGLFTFTGGNGGNGQRGIDGLVGENGLNGADYTKEQGGDGEDGKTGGLGGNGGMGASAICSNNLIIEAATVIAQSGNGGNGGQGGDGGNGGNGGKGGSNYNFFNCSAGVGGNGGKGGLGGNGGNGGNVACAVDCESIEGTISKKNGNVGVAGAGGEGGFGGIGGAGGWRCTGAGGLYNSVTMVRVDSGESFDEEQSASGLSGTNGCLMEGQ